LEGLQEDRKGTRWPLEANPTGERRLESHLPTRPPSQPPVLHAQELWPFFSELQRAHILADPLEVDMGEGREPGDALEVDTGEGREPGDVFPVKIILSSLPLP